MNEETDKAGSVPVKLNWQWPHLTLATETIKSVVQGNELLLTKSVFVVILIRVFQCHSSRNQMYTHIEVFMYSFFSKPS